MKNIFKIFVLVTSLTALGTWSGNAYAAACTSAASGNWSAAATWAAPCNVLGGPTAADTVTIAAAHTVTVNVNSAAISIAVTAPSGAANGVTLGAGITLAVSGAITMPAPAVNNRTSTFAVGTGTLNAGSITINGGTGGTRISQVTVSTGTITVSGNITFGGTAAQARLISTGASTINIGGTVSGAGTPTLNAIGNTVNYTGAAQTVMATAYYHLGLGGSGAKTMTGVTAIGGDLNISGTATMTANAALTVTGALNYSSTGATTLTAATPISIGSYNQTAGTLVDNGNTITVTGTGANTWTQTAGTFTTTGTVTFTGAAPQIGVSNFNNLTINVGAGNTATLTGNATLSGLLTLTSGRISTGANILDAGASCVGVTGSATSYVLGNLRLHYPTAAGTTTCTFPVGDATAYTPVAVAMVNVSSTLANSTLTASTTTGDHPDTTAGTSGIDAAKSVNRYWTLTPGAGLTFVTYNTTFNFIASDIDVGATTANFIIGRKIGGVWSYPTMGLKNPTNTAATGMTQAGGFGEFAIGESLSISGTVFEDINYGGGAGRDQTTSAGVAISGARVELYNSAGNFVSFATTNASGTYGFDNLANGTYTVRVASNGATGVRSTRTGGAACATCVPVQTYRTNAGSGTAAAVTDHVGGENPSLLDAADNTTSATLASLTTATTTAQSITTVTKGVSTVTGVDFGFNFDTIVSVRNTGQGSLRQFITNANALGGEAALAQQGLTAGLETSVFMIPNGVANPGQNTGYTNQLTTSGSNAGAAVITLASALPAISGANVSLDGTTQTTNVGDTNFGTVGTGGTVGVAAVALPQFNRPEVVIAAAATQLSGTGSPVYIKGLAVSNGGIIVSGASSVVQDCLAGMDANGTVTTIYSANFGITAGAGAGIIIHHNYVKVNDSGIRGDSPGANLTIEYNEVDSPQGTPGGGQTATFDGVLIVNSATNATVQYNLVKNQEGGALEFGFGTGAVTGLVLDNTALNSGYTGGVPSTEGMGVAFYSLAAGTAITFKQNIVTGSSRAGIAVVPGTTALTASGIIMTQNSIYSNGTIGIDLNPIQSDPNTYTAQGVTLNDLNDADNGPDGLLNFPILATATISGGNLVLTGWARPGSAIELFIATPDPSGFGEGKTYLTTLTEGSVADTDATVSTYGPGAINGLAQGTDNTNRFNFSIALPAGVSNGTTLTSTATRLSATSEFSGNVVVGAPNPSITLLKTVAVYSDPVNGTTTPKFIPGAIAQYTIIASNSGGPADYNSTVITDPIPANTQLYVNDIGSVGSGPVLFIQGGTSSTLAYTFTSLSSLTDNLDFSNDGGTSWTAIPTAGPNGCDTTAPPITNIRVKPQGTFIGGSPNPSFQLTFRVCVQ